MNSTHIVSNPPRGISPRATYLAARRRAIRAAEFHLLSAALEHPEGTPARRRAVLRARVLREVARVCEESAAPVPFVLLRGRTGWPPDSALDAALAWLVNEEWLAVVRDADRERGECRRYDLGRRTRESRA